MSIGDRFKDLKKFASDKIQDRKDYVNKRREIIKDLTMPHLRDLEDNYDITILTMIGDDPSREDYIASIARTKKVPTEQLKKFVDRVNKKEELELKNPETKQIIQNIQGNQILKDSTLIGDVNITQNIFKDWSLEIMNSNIDFNLRKEAIQKIKNLEEEINKPNRDQSVIDKLYQWFTKNKEELATLSIPFITKLLGNI